MFRELSNGVPMYCAVPIVIESDANRRRVDLKVLFLTFQYHVARAYSESKFTLSSVLGAASTNDNSALR